MSIHEEVTVGRMLDGKMAVGHVDAKPFLKWAGGKTQLLPKIIPHVPKKFGRYFEPFVGAGSLFFALQAAGRISAARGAVLGDVNEHLLATYRALRASPHEVVARLKELEVYYWKQQSTKRKSGMYYAMREEFNDKHTQFDRPGTAAYVIFLNKTCFNGLWRVNADGEFNVPWGKHENPLICDEANLMAVSKALLFGKALILRNDFELTVSQAREGDFVYFDPPYWPASGTADFTSYASSPFGPNEQRRLRDVACKLKARGVHVLLSNSDVEPIRELYAKGFVADGFEIERIEARRNINSKGKKRGPVGELLIW